MIGSSWVIRRRERAFKATHGSDRLRPYTSCIEEEDRVEDTAANAADGKRAVEFWNANDAVPTMGEESCAVRFGFDDVRQEEGA